MMETKFFEGMIEKIRFILVKKRKELSQTEGKYMTTPTNLLAHEVVRLQGEIKGIRTALDVLETARGETALKLVPKDTEFH